MEINKDLLRVAKAIIYLKENSKLLNYFKNFQVEMIENLEEIINNSNILYIPANINLKDELKKQWHKYIFDDLELFVIITNLFY